MAALTQISQTELANWLPQYGVGELSDYQRISTGIENSNYFVNTTDTTDVHRWVVTILEAELPLPGTARTPCPRVTASRVARSTHRCQRI